MEIKLLPPEVVDQIAAGEVVERPSHLIKEIVENSIDAGATKITVDYADGGRFVKVGDNGKGMTAAEMPLALQRFATSKISEANDLWKLRTFGFRGEALASISSVSRLTMTSRKKGAETAYQLISEFGKKTEIDPTGGSEGTTIIVEQLFENTPARLKFLKSDVAEHGAIRTTLKSLALAHPQVEFRVTEANKMLYFWPACASKKDRAEQILEVKPLYEGYDERGNVRAYAVFADPHNVAKTSKNIWLFAQNRSIQDRSIQAAVVEAFRNMLMHGEFPIAAVWVETDPESIDVNIHPTKSQVKFQDPSLPFRAVAAAIRGTLEQAPWIQSKVEASGLKMQMSPGSAAGSHTVKTSLGDVTVTHPGGGAVQVPAQNLQFEDQALAVTQFAKKEFPLLQPTQNPELFKDPAVHQREVPVAIRQSGGNSNIQNVTRVSLDDLAAAAESRAALSTSLSAKAEVKSGSAYWSSLDVLGQANQTYIVCQARDKMVFVDQHAAHERVVFERLMEAWKGGKIDIQDYLFPLAVDISPEKVEALMLLEKDIAKLGVHIESLGPGTVGVKAAPTVIKESVLGAVLDKMATQALEQGGSFALEKAIGDICATMACHSVVRAGQTLSVEQMKNLLSEMDLYPMSSFCPHGRPVSVEYPFVKLEKDFGRIV